MKIGVIATGNMGRSLGLLWAANGHDVLFGHRDREKARKAASLSNSGAQFGSNDDAAAFGDVVVYGVRGVPPAEVLSSTDVLAGKPVIDCNNREVPEDYAFGPLMDESLAERLQKGLPESHVIKAFNTFSMEVFEHSPDEVRQHGVSVYLCGDNEAAKRTVSGLSTELGFAPVDCGPLRSARMVEALGDFIRFLIGKMERGAYATISVRDLPAAAEHRLGGREEGKSSMPDSSKATPGLSAGFSEPGARHRDMSSMVGKWKIEMATHTGGDPDVVTRSSEVYADKSWFGGERYLREEVRGTFGGSAHIKTTILGYSNVRRRYEYVTADNYDTAIVFYTSFPGQERDGSVITLFGDYAGSGDALKPAGIAVSIRTVIEIEGPDRHTLRNYYCAAGASEYLFLEYIYTRVA